jgi:anti-sigma28 factor (negative regulator of flagellin synthesis)
MEENRWEKLLERIECGETTVDDAALVRDLLDKVADLEQMLSECMGADIAGG